jgi:hypothetical protein
MFCRKFGIRVNRETPIFQNSKSPPKILGATAQNLLAQETWNLKYEYPLRQISQANWAKAVTLVTCIGMCRVRIFYCRLSHNGGIPPLSTIKGLDTFTIKTGMFRVCVITNIVKLVQFEAEGTTKKIELSKNSN